MEDNPSENPENSPPEKPESDQPEDLYGKVVFRISRRKLIEDGTLLDISTAAREAGIVFPTALTGCGRTTVTRSRRRSRSVSCGICAGCSGAPPETRSRAASSKTSFSETKFFHLLVKVRATGRTKLAEVKAVCSPGDDLEPVITLLPEED
jgi:hypothetical protein